MQKLRATIAAGTTAGANVNAKTLFPDNAATGPVDFTNGRSLQQYASFINNTLAYDQFRTGGSSHYHRPRGSFKIDQIFQSGDMKTSNGVPGLADTDVYVKFTVVEPLFVPPFLAGCDNEGHHPGFYGIQQLQHHGKFCN